MINYIMDYGAMQAKDLNPAAPGLSTAALTNPTYEKNLEAQEAVATGEVGKTFSPLRYILLAAVLIVVVGYLQK